LLKNKLKTSFAKLKKQSDYAQTEQYKALRVKYTPNRYKKQIDNNNNVTVLSENES
jgi:hypothetical protein